MLNKPVISGDINLIGCGIETSVTVMMGAIPKKYTGSRAEIHFVFIVESEMRIT